MGRGLYGTEGGVSYERLTIDVQVEAGDVRRVSCREIDHAAVVEAFVRLANVAQSNRRSLQQFDPPHVSFDHRFTNALSLEEDGHLDAALAPLYDVVVVVVVVVGGGRKEVAGQNFPTAHSCDLLRVCVTSTRCLCKARVIRLFCDFYSFVQQFSSGQLSK